MFVKPFAACGALLLSALVTIGLCSSDPALAASEGDAAPAGPVLEGVPQIPEASPTWYQEATAGTPDQSIWRTSPSKAQSSRAPESHRPALDKPMMLLNGLFEPSRTSSFPHP